MNLTERRARLIADLGLAEQQRDRLLAASRDASIQVEQFRGAIALIDELLAAEPEPDPPLGSLPPKDGHAA
jgi:hypothetical protein